MPRTNRDKGTDPVIDEVLNEPVPPVDEASPKEDLESKPAILKPEEVPDEPEIPTEPVETTLPVETPKKVEIPVETEEQKQQRYKAQQTEAFILSERNKALANTVDEAAKLQDPNEAELRQFVGSTGSDYDELTNFERVMAKKAYLNEKRFAMVNESVQSAKKIDEWAGNVDKFIDESDSKPEALLSSHEADFRKYCMQPNHRGVDLDILMGAFLHNLPSKPAKRTTLFPTGGGEREENKGDTIGEDEAAALRVKDPREYARKIKAGKVRIEI